jgi:methylaspartate mutase epsilon subunit
MLVTKPLPFGKFVRAASAAGCPVVQPRMGFSDPDQMHVGLRATRNVAAPTVGTITLDSYTRLGDNAAARRAVAQGEDLNGYPLVAHSPEVTRHVLDGVHDASFPVQVRHGSARPEAIFAALTQAGLSVSEGGPVSYCLPYGRVPLDESVRNWVRCCRQLAESAAGPPHLETFGGCMLGQLCPPSLLVAISLLEAMFFAEHGITDVSLSYAQQTNPEQDTEAIMALRRLAHEFLAGIDTHVVVYAYMGVYPRTRPGAQKLLTEAAQLATRTGSERLIVKTTAEAHRIPTISENVQALRSAAGAATAAGDQAGVTGPAADTGVYAEARAIVGTLLDLASSRGLAAAFVTAFHHGLLDVPFCLHPDNQGRTSSYIDADGTLRWAATGRLPIGPVGTAGRTRSISSDGLLSALTYVQRTFDGPALPARRVAALPRPVREPALAAPAIT